MFVHNGRGELEENICNMTYPAKRSHCTLLSRQCELASLFGFLVNSPLVSGGRSPSFDVR